MKILITFKSKNQAMLFSNMLIQSRVRNRVINTPRFLSLSCGLAVEAEMSNIMHIRQLLGSYNFDSFGGMYVINQNGTFDSIKP